MTELKLDNNSTAVKTTAFSGPGGFGASHEDHSNFMTSLIGKSREDLDDLLLQLEVPQKQINMRRGQIWRWIYNAGVRQFDQMQNVSKDLRQKLAREYSLDRPKITQKLVSVDGTRKYLIEIAPGLEVETVYIPDVARAGALCISTQIGCTLTCSFCRTGTQKLVRNLTVAEIVAQIMLARDDLNEWPGLSNERLLTNIVFMGMGEPLLNYDNLIAALNIMTDHEGLSIGKRRITVSTSGIVPKIKALGEQADPMLAISLHAVDDALRDELVPINKKWPINELLDACRNYPGLSNAKRITFEYVMLKGINDSKADAKLLVKKLQGIPAKVNLIPFNPWPGSPYQCADWEQIENFSDWLNRGSLAAPIRTPRGRDILAACGQLRSESIKQRASKSV